MTIFALLNKRSTMFVVHAICLVSRYLEDPCNFWASFAFSYRMCILTASLLSSSELWNVLFSFIEVSIECSIVLPFVAENIACFCVLILVLLFDCVDRI